MRNLIVMKNRGIVPFSYLSDFDRAFDSFFGNAARDYSSDFDNDYLPDYDFKEDGDHYLMSVDLPGVKKEDINVEINEGILTVSGERKDETSGNGFSRKSYGSFSRSVRLPEDVKENGIEALYENGVLRLAFAKAEKPEPKKIEVNEGGRSGIWSRLLGNQSKEQ